MTQGGDVKTPTTVFLLACATAVYAQNPGNPFHDHSDTGETVHVLPVPASLRSQRDTQPSLAPAHKGTAVYAASYGSGNLLYHGGPEISGAAYQAIYWNASVANAVRTQVDGFIASFSDGSNWDNSSTDDYTIVQQYGTSVSGIASTLKQVASLVDNKNAVSRYADSQIQSYLTGLFNARKATPSGSTLYGIYFPSGMRICLQGGCSCTSFCGYHSSYSYNGVSIKYAVFPYPDCTGCSISGLSVVNMLTILSSHEIREAVTDPNGNAWYDASGYEADDKCVWHNLYQTSRGYWVQPEYSNGGAITASGFSATYPGPGCVVPNR